MSIIYHTTDYNLNSEQNQITYEDRIINIPSLSLRLYFEPQYIQVVFLRGHPFSTYAVRGRVKFCLFPYVRPYKKLSTGGQKWLNCCVRTIWMTPYEFHARLS